MNVWCDVAVVDDDEGGMEKEASIFSHFRHSNALILIFFFF